MKKFILTLLSFVVLFTLVEQATSQVQRRDIYSNLMETPTWPPPDSLFDHYTITVWFSENAINQEYLCDYWSYYSNPPKIEKDNSEKIQGWLGALGSGCYEVDTNIITSHEIVDALHNLSAVKMCQYSRFSPCEDTLSITRTGDTIPTPHFWNSFYITLDSAWAVQAVAYLNMMFGGTLIRFAEFNGYITQDATPNDPAFQSSLSYHTGFLYQGIDAAWDLEHGNRNVKVAVVDKGIKYYNELIPWDLYNEGTGIGGKNRVVDGAVYNYPLPRVQPSPNTEGQPIGTGDHGTAVAGLISAIVNNNIQIAGIAGGWNEDEGISLINIKCDGNAESFWKNTADGWIDAAANTSGGKGFGVNIITNSNGSSLYSEEKREALDYAYRMGVHCFASTGDYGIVEIHEPATSDYFKICAVGAYGIARESDPPNNWVPTYQLQSTDNGISFNPCSNWGYGLDLLGQGDNFYYRGNPILINQTLLCSYPWVRLFGYTSAACPQVAGTASLMLSNYLYKPHTNIDGLAFEDVQGLLSISAMDLNYNWMSTNIPPNIFFTDTSGYDAHTGYGMLKANMSLQYMQLPYQLRYFTDSSGFSTGFDPLRIDPFIILETNDNYYPLLAPTSLTNMYYADRYIVRKTILLTGWELARSWGRSGQGTKGWSGVQPSDPPTNSSGIYQTGYCRVVGNPDAEDNNPSNFNYYNIRDICYSNDEITLETYCYRVYRKSNNEDLGWFPCSPENVVYRYSIWGIKTPDNISQESKNFLSNSTISVNCEQENLIGSPYLLIHYIMSLPAPVTIQIFDLLGNQIYVNHRNIWTEEPEQTFSVNMNEYPSGPYFIIVKSSNATGFAKTIIVK